MDIYDSNPKEYFERTFSVDMTSSYNFFLKYFSGKMIFDCGCGSGRDSIAFKNRGYDVISGDISEKLAVYASNKTGLEIIKFDMLRSKLEQKVDGIWLCASLVHFNINQIEKVLENLRRSIKDEGIMYLSLKVSDKGWNQNGMYYHQENSIVSVLNNNFTIINRRINEDNMKRDIKWLEVIIRISKNKF